MKKKLKKLPGFTLVEMLIVLLIISVLVLLFVPNMAKHKDAANNGSDDAIVKVVETQMELYQLENPGEPKPKAEDLVDEYITEDQLKKYNNASAE